MFAWTLRIQMINYTLIIIHSFVFMALWYVLSYIYFYLNWLVLFTYQPVIIISFMLLYTLFINFLLFVFLS